MARSSDQGKALAYGGLIALGLMALSSAGRSARRRDFYQVLRERLAEYTIELVSAELGRRSGEAVWVVAVEIAGSAAAVEVTVTDPEPYSENAAIEVADSVADSLGA